MFKKKQRLLSDFSREIENQHRATLLIPHLALQLHKRWFFHTKQKSSMIGWEKKSPKNFIPKMLGKKHNLGDKNIIQLIFGKLVPTDSGSFFGQVVKRSACGDVFLVDLPEGGKLQPRGELWLDHCWTCERYAKFQERFHWIPQNPLR